MKLTHTRLPLVIALSSALAFTVGCADRTADDGVDQNAPVTAATPADTMTPADPTDRDSTQAAAMDDAQRQGMDNDRRPSDQPASDTWITTKVKSSLLADTDVAGLEINVETVNGVVTLTGKGAQQAQIDEATRIAREIDGVTDVRTTGFVVGGN